jgi:hypothetical protein
VIEHELVMLIEVAPEPGLVIDLSLVVEFALVLAMAIEFVAPLACGIIFVSIIVVTSYESSADKHTSSHCPGNERIRKEIPPLDEK